MLRGFNNHHALSGKARLNLKSFDEYVRFINDAYYHPSKVIENNCPDHLLVINLYLISLSSVAVSAIKGTPNGVQDKNVLLKTDFSGSDIHLGSFLNNICNTTSAAISLIKQGYDTQARVLIRTLDERIYQCIVLFSSSSDYEKWDEAEDQDDAKNAHYSLFAKKGRILKRITELEEKYLGFKDHQLELRAWRKEREVYYSMAVHGSSAAVMVGSASFSFEDESIMMPNLFGHPSSASRGTLSHIIYQLHFFLLLLPEILKDVHKWKPSIENEFEKTYLAYSDIALVIGSNWITQENREG